MVFAPHTRLTFSGVFGTLAAPWERWSFRLNTNPVSVGSDLAPALVAARNAWSANLQAMMGPEARLTEVKLARINELGKYSDDPVILESDLPGTASAGAQFPSQVAMAVSLVTDTRGAAGRGRFYLPAPRRGVSTGGALSAGDAQDFATLSASFLGALNAIPALDLVVVASSKGTNSVVTGVRTGRVYDTIRSRRTSIDEAYGATLAVAQVNG